MAFYKSSRKSFNSIYAIKEMNKKKKKKNRTYDEDFIIRRNINQIIINGVNDNIFCIINCLDVNPNDFNIPYSNLLL